MQDTQDKQAWRNFSGTDWKTEINVRDFIVANVTPYSGASDFLAKHLGRAATPSDQPWVICARHSMRRARPSRLAPPRRREVRPRSPGTPHIPRV